MDDNQNYCIFANTWAPQLPESPPYQQDDYFKHSRLNIEDEQKENYYFGQTQLPEDLQGLFKNETNQEYCCVSQTNVNYNLMKEVYSNQTQLISPNTEPPSPSGFQVMDNLTYAQFPQGQQPYSVETFQVLDFPNENTQQINPAPQQMFEIKVVCQLCNKSFNKMHYLKQHHKQCHDDKKTFRCRVCGKRYSTHEILKSHFQKHSSEQKLFKCEFCPKSYNFKCDLKRHMSCHSGIKTHVCVHCGKGFMRNDHLKNHMKVHLERKTRI